MTDYVCGFMRDRAGNLALVRKKKPKWQEGSLNGIGGAVEPGEAVYEAMIREWAEETGRPWASWSKFAKLSISGGAVHFFKTSVTELPTFPPANDIGEPIEVVPYEVAIRTPTGGMIQNLKWLLPLAFEDNGTSVEAIAA